MPNAFLYSIDTAEPVTHALTLDALQQTVGGYIEPAFTIPSPTRDGYALTGYVNDSGAIDGLPVCVLTSTTGALAGPMIVCGLNYGDGETVGLTPEELDWLDERTRMVAAFGANGAVTYAVHALDLDLDLDD